MTHAEYLYSLPEPVQAELVQIAREAIGMTGEEKGAAAALFATVATHFALGKGDDDFIPGALMVSAPGVLLRCADDQATINRQEVA